VFYLAAWDIEVSPPLVVMHACFSLIFYDILWEETTLSILYLNTELVSPVSSVHVLPNSSCYVLLPIL
jgi:hypothetical protein